jgi:F420-dependent oxidoreductase-like protein
MRLRLLVEPQQGASYDDVLHFAVQAERLGFDGIFTSDHYLGAGAVPSPLPPCDAWTTVAGLARDTTRIKLGTLVTPVTFRRPGPLAILARQVDTMSGGRVTLGLGAGWHEPEHEAYGLPFPGTATRFRQLEEQLQIVRGIWETPTGKTFTFTGRHASLKDVPGYGASPPGHRPSILIGGSGPRKTPRLAAAYADEYNVPVRSLDVTREQFGRAGQACRLLGRDPGSLVLSAAQVLCAGETSAELARRADRLGRSVNDLTAAGVAGTVDQVIQKIGAFAGIGATRLYLQCLDLADIEQLHLVAERVMPLAGQLHARDTAIASDSKPEAEQPS